MGPFVCAALSLCWTLLISGFLAYALPESQGSDIHIVLTIPVLAAGLALVPLPGAGRTPMRIASAFLLCVFAYVTGFSIGMFYAASVMLMVIAAIWSALY